MQAHIVECAYCGSPLRIMHSVNRMIECRYCHEHNRLTINDELVKVDEWALVQDSELCDNCDVAPTPEYYRSEDHSSNVCGCAAVIVIALLCVGVGWVGCGRFWSKPKVAPPVIVSVTAVEQPKSTAVAPVFDINQMAKERIQIVKDCSTIGDGFFENYDSCLTLNKKTIVLSELYASCTGTKECINTKKPKTVGEHMDASYQCTFNKSHSHINVCWKATSKCIQKYGSRNACNNIWRTDPDFKIWSND